jgi:hypothetical protein
MINLFAHKDRIGVRHTVSGGYMEPIVSRRKALMMGIAGTVVASSRRLSGHDLKPGDPAYQFGKYESIVNRELTIRQVYEWPNISNAIVFANVNNGLNGFQFSYDIPPNQIQVVVQPFYTANAAVYDDYIWQKYKFGLARNIKDPATGEFAVRNIFYPSASAAPDQVPADRSDPYYSDTSIQGLQRRGVLFLC